MTGRWADSQHNQNRSGSGWDEQAAARRILKRDGHRCYYHGPDCIGTATQVDHVIPTSITGPAGDHDGNKKAICPPCHTAKTKLESAAGRAKKSRRRPAERHPGVLSERGGG